MKDFWRYFEQMLLALLFAIPLGCVTGALLFLATFSLIGGNEGRSFVEQLQVLTTTSLFAVLVCLPFGLFFGAPIGAILFRNNWANPWTAAAAGLCPALLALVFVADQEGGVLSAMIPAFFGLPVALLTYWLARGRIDRWA